MDHAGRISRAGDQVQRSLLFAAAQCLALRSSGQAPTLAARFEALAARTGRKQALVALARKRAVLMHGLQHFQAGWKQPAARNMRQRKGLERLA
jgi:transposase